MTTDEDFTSDVDKKTSSSCVSCKIGKRIVPEAYLSIEDEKNDCITLSNSVRLIPCGCRFCKDCFIQYLAQTHGEPVLLCPDCGSIVASHRTTITDRCDSWAKLPPSKGSNLSLTSRVVVGVVEHHYSRSKHETCDVNKLDPGAGSTPLKSSANTAQENLDETPASKADQQEEHATGVEAGKGVEPDELRKGEESGESKKSDEPDELANGDEPDELIEGRESDESIKADELMKGDKDYESTEGDEPSESETGEKTTTPKTATVSARKRKYTKKRTSKKASYNPGGAPTVRSESGVPTIRSLKKRSAPSSAREASPSPFKKYRKFDDHFEELVKFKARYGATWVPHHYVDLSLARWFHDIRLGQRKISEEQKERLDRIGFHWGDKPKKPRAPKETKPKRPYRTFDDHFQELLEYKQKYGNGFVSVNHSNFNSLERWVNAVRKGIRKVSEEEKIKLDAVGFVWENIPPPDVELHPDQIAKLGKQYKPRKSFEQRVMDLLEYKKEHGDCYVPYLYKGKQNLGDWVKDIRRGQIEVTKEKRKRLNEIGFVWETKANRMDREWQEKLDKLKDYKQAHGDLVVRRTEYYKTLCDWCGTQRRLHKQGLLRADRKAMLDEIGFSWGRRFRKSSRRGGGDGDGNGRRGEDDSDGRRSEDDSDNEDRRGEDDSDSECRRREDDSDGAGRGSVDDSDGAGRGTEDYSDDEGRQSYASNDGRNEIY